MPELDFAFLADRIASAEGVAHVLGVGIDTVYVQQPPVLHSLAMLSRFTFRPDEAGREYQVGITFEDEHGNHLVEFSTGITPQSRDLPDGWLLGVLLPANVPVPLPHYGLYAVGISLDGHLVKSIPLRVTEPPNPA